MHLSLPSNKQTHRQIWLMAGIFSLILHFIMSGGLAYVSSFPTKPRLLPVKIRVNSQAEVKPQDPTPTPPKKKQHEKKRQLKPNEQPQPDKPTTNIPVQGLTKDSLSPTGTMAAPIGNTLMTGDIGQRLKDVVALKGDLSQPAKLIASSLNAPPYTDDALDAAIEGSFVVDVFVNLDGSVREAELRKKIGYGMDARVIAAVKDSKFIPRKNAYGVNEEGWTELKFTLVIP